MHHTYTTTQMHNLLSISLTLKITNPSKKTLTALSNILIQNSNSLATFQYSSIDVSKCKVKTFINPPQISPPLSIDNNIHNLKIINTLLDT